MKKFLSSLKETFSILKLVYKSSKLYIVFLILQSIINSILPFVEILFSYRIIDAIINGVGKNQILRLAFTMILITFIMGILLKIFNYLIEVFGIKMMHSFQNKIIYKSFALDYEQTEENEVMKLIKKAEDGQNSSGSIESYCRVGISNTLSNILKFVYSIILISGLLATKTIESSNILVKVLNSPYSILFVICTLILNCVMEIIIMKKQNKASYETMIENIDGNRKYGYFYDVCSDYNYGKEIRIYGMQKMIYSELTNSKYSVDTHWRGFMDKSIKYNIIIQIFSKLLSFISYVYVGLKAITKLISIGSVVSYVASITYLSQSITSLLESYSEIILMNNYLSNYFTFISLDNNNDYGTRTLNKTEKIKIEFKNVYFKYPHQDNYILEDFSLIINEGTKLAIVGANGAGKTTIIKLLCRLYKPESGDILINDISIKEFTKESCYELFSIVFQDFALFSYSIKDNVCSGLNGNEELAYKCLDKAGIKEKVLNMDNQINTILYNKNREKGVEISGGEAQKIAIARALYKDSPIVVLDEPTSALDPKSEAEIYEKFNYLVENKTSIFISHRMSSCKFCDEILVLDKGKIVEKGSHEALLHNKNLYYRMWNAQAQYYI